MRRKQGTMWCTYALFDDHKVKWVPEQEILSQEASILIYSRTIARQGQVTDQPITTMEDPPDTPRSAQRTPT